MRKRSTLHVVLALCLLSRTLFADDATSPVLTGTVNIVLANANGIVVLTDSNQTGRLPDGTLFTSPLPARKLFRIDDRTVCTIAGFGSRPFPGYQVHGYEFIGSAGGVLERYSADLRSLGGVHTFHEKLTTLRFQFDMLLFNLGNLQHLGPGQVEDYGFTLILAGYDSDGTAKIGKLVFTPSLSANGTFYPVIKPAIEENVGRELMHETAGIGGAAVENILEYPGQLAGEPEIGTYATSLAKDHGSSLTITQMESLARSLAHHAASVNPYVSLGNFRFREVLLVGGPDQIAIMEKGVTQRVEQPDVSSSNGMLEMPFSFIERSRFEGDSIPPNASTIELFLKNIFRGPMEVTLDAAYYFDNDFGNVTLYYDGGVILFDSSNRVTDCVLHLGPHADRQSAVVQELITRFPWKKVQ
jgi:hypothetical protein